MKGLTILVAAVALVILVALAGGPILERNRRVGEMEALRSLLDQARVSADSCMVALAREEQDFFRFDRTVDSLRAETESYEDPDQGGVPEAVYEEYLESFDLYNSSVELWQIRVDGLQALEARCRALVGAYNDLRDSVRVREEEIRGGT